MLLLEPQDQRDPAAGQRADVITQQGVKRVIKVAQGWQLDLQAGLALVLQMAADQRCTTREGNADIQIVGVLECAGAEHAVGVNHRVGFGPDNLLARLGRTVEQVRGTGETQLRTHSHVSIAQGTGRYTECRVDP